jgi:hypothetical protein
MPRGEKKKKKNRKYIYKQNENLQKAIIKNQKINKSLIKIRTEPPSSRPLAHH